MIRQGSYAAVVNRKGEILLQLRSDAPIWGLPGGGKIAEETPVQTLLRETFEETGLRVRPERLAGTYFVNYGIVREKSYVFLCRIMGGKLRKNRESLELDFFSIKQLPKPILYFHKERILDALSRINNAKKVQKLNVFRILGDISFNPLLFFRLALFPLRACLHLQKIYK